MKIKYIHEVKYIHEDKPLERHLKIRFCGWGLLLYFLNLLLNPFLGALLLMAFGDFGLFLGMFIGLSIVMASTTLVLYGIFK
jgi:hypothetical protein